MQVDTDAAFRFLSFLDYRPRFWHMQTADDNQAAKADALVHPLRFDAKRLESALAALVRYNDAGAGVWFAPNAHGNAPRQLWNVKYIRAITLDLDAAPLEPVLRHAMPPSIVVETSPGKHHVYWLTCNDFPKEHEYFGVQRRLAAMFGGDPAIANPNHVLRLPGFIHRKREPFQVRVVHMSTSKPATISTRLLLAAFPPLLPEVDGSEDMHRGILTADDLAELLSALDVYDFAAHDEWFALMCAAWYLTDGAGEKEWVEWSAENKDFGNLTRETGRRWRSLHNRPYGTPVTGATLLKALNNRAVKGDTASEKKAAAKAAAELADLMRLRESEVDAGLNAGDANAMDAYIKAHPHG